MKNIFEPVLCGFQRPFLPLGRPPTPDHCPCYWFIFRAHSLLLIKENDRLRIPLSLSPPLPREQIETSRCIGLYGDTPCMLLTVRETHESLNLEPVNVREAYSLVPGDLWIISGRASQIMRWEQDNTYCGRCGSAMFEPDSEMIKRCPSCSFSAYPRISPAVIMSVTRGSEILLGRSPRFPSGMYSTLAGFVEPGETAEEAVKREVSEETGIIVNNLRYIGSQAWPFPHSLMLGFTAEYLGGEIEVDRVELEDAGWFSPDNMPRLPSTISIARKLIDNFMSEAQGAER